MKALMIADWNSALQQRGHWADRRGDVGAYRTRKPILKPTTEDNEWTVDGGGDNYTLTGRPKSFFFFLLMCKGAATILLSSGEYP